MRVLVTGATGFVGNGVVRALLARGEDVLGLARSERSGAALQAQGVTPHRGDLADPDALADAAGRVDAVVHAGFPRDAYADLDAAVALDRGAVATLLRATSGTATRLLYVSGIGVLGGAADASGTVHDDTVPDPPEHMRWRREMEIDVLAAGGQVVRPVFVHGRGSGDIPISLVRAARERGEAAYPLPGTNPWPTVHVDDLGDAVALAVVSGPDGLCANVVSAETTAQAVSGRIADLLGVPARGLPVEEADAVVPYARWLGGAFHVRADRVRDVLGWRPHGPDLIDDLALTYVPGS